MPEPTGICLQCREPVYQEPGEKFDDVHQCPPQEPHEDCVCCGTEVSPLDKFLARLTPVQDLGSEVRLAQMRMKDFPKEIHATPHDIYERDRLETMTAIVRMTRSRGFYVSYNLLCAAEARLEGK